MKTFEACKGYSEMVLAYLEDERSMKVLSAQARFSAKVSRYNGNLFPRAWSTELESKCGNKYRYSIYITSRRGSELEGREALIGTFWENDGFGAIINCHIIENAPIVEILTTRFLKAYAAGHSIPYDAGTIDHYLNYQSSLRLLENEDGRCLFYDIHGLSEAIPLRLPGVDRKCFLYYYNTPLDSIPTEMMEALANGGVNLTIEDILDYSSPKCVKPYRRK